MLVTVLDLFSV